MLRRTLLALWLVPTLALPLTAGEVRGVLTKVDLDQHQLLLEGRGRGARGQTLSIQFSADTRFEAGGQPARVADLAPGKRVRVLFELREGQRTATLVSWIGQPAAAPASPLPADPNALAGRLERVAFTEREITILSPAEKGAEPVETTLPVAKDVVILKEDKPIRFDDLKEGEQVVVKFEEREGRRVAKAIAVGAAVRSEARRGEKLREVLKLLEGVLQQMRERRP